jgi:hypothetical protein
MRMAGLDEKREANQKQTDIRAIFGDHHAALPRHNYITMCWKLA